MSIRDRNRYGNCAICGAKLDWYSTKAIHKITNDLICIGCIYHPRDDAGKIQWEDYEIFSDG